MNFFKKQILGVDLGARTIKGVKLKKGKDGRVSLVGHFFQDLAQLSENFPEKCNRSEVLKATIETQQLSSSHAATAIRDSDVMSLVLSLPPMSDKELAQVVPQEISEQTQIAIEEHSCDYLVSSAPAEDPNMTLVKAYCVKRDVVFQQMDLLKEAGLKPNSIESEMLAITAMLDFNGYIDRNEVQVVIDLGESHLTSGLIVDGSLALTRSHDVSFGKVNRELRDKCSMSYDEAEKLKLSYDFLSVPEKTVSPVNMVLDDVFTEIFKSIKETLEFYKECRESYGRIDRILLLGGGSQVIRIAAIHETFFKTPTDIVNPFRNIDIFNSTHSESNDEIAQLAPYMGTAVGLALASISLKGAA